LDLVVDDRLVDIVANQCDAGVRLGELVEKDMVAVKVSGYVEMMVVAAPSYLDRCGSPETPRDLRGHRCVNFRWPAEGRLYRWEFERGEEKLEVTVDGPLIANDPEVMLRAVLDGVGIGYIYDRQVRPYIVTGKVVHLLQEWTPPFPGFYLYYPSRRQMPAALRAFVDFLSQQSASRLTQK
jgi:DNA-binding transcriptional LysR family regulator